MDLSNEGDLLIFIVVILICVALAILWCVYRQVKCFCCCCTKTYNLVTA